MSEAKEDVVVPLAMVDRHLDARELSRCPTCGRASSGPADVTIAYREQKDVALVTATMHEDASVSTAVHNDPLPIEAPDPPAELYIDARFTCDICKAVFPATIYVWPCD